MKSQVTCCSLYTDYSHLVFSWNQALSSTLRAHQCGSEYSYRLIVEQIVVHVNTPILFTNSDCKLDRLDQIESKEGGTGAKQVPQSPHTKKVSSQICYNRTGPYFQLGLPAIGFLSKNQNYMSIKVITVHVEFFVDVFIQYNFYKPA